MDNNENITSPLTRISHEQLSNSAVGKSAGKRTRSEIATPRKPGTAEAQIQEEMEYVYTPARAPPSLKRVFRPASPLGNLELVNDEDNLMSLTWSMSSPEEKSTASFSQLSLDSGVRGSNSLMTTPGAPKFDMKITATPDPKQAESSTDMKSNSVLDDAAPPVPSASLASSTSSVPLNNDGMDVDTNEPSAPSPECTYETLSNNGSGNNISLASPSYSAGSSEPNTYLNSVPTEQPNTSTLIHVSPSSTPTTSRESCNQNESNVTTPLSETAAAEAAEATSIATIVSDSTSSPEPAQPEKSADVAVSPETKQSSLDTASPRITSLIGVNTPHKDTITPDASANATSTNAKSTPYVDPEVLYAASIPLPTTPEMQVGVAAAQNTSSKKYDFYIPTNWLMNPGSGSRASKENIQSTHESPLKGRSPRFTESSTTTINNSIDNSDSDNDLIPMTPVNKRLLDELDIQWVAPNKVPKFSDEDMDTVHIQYKEKIASQEAEYKRLLDLTKESFDSQIKAQAEASKRSAEESESRFKAELERQAKEHAEEIAKMKKMHTEDISKRDEDTRIQVAQLNGEVEKAIAERNEISTMLNDYVTTSTTLIDKKESENNGLSKELGRLTLDRQRLNQSLEETNAKAEALSGERDELQKRMDSLMSENMRLEGLVSDLRNDILVAEERCTKIREYAEDTLSRANNELSNLHSTLETTKQEALTLKTQASKSDARVRSLQIQLDSTKRQNEELLSLCESALGQ